MDKNYLLVSLDDEKSKNISEVIGSKSCKKILDLLSEKELSESDISQRLEIPLNTAEYNIKKLLSSGLIEKSKHWWSVKGKKIEMYRLSNKYIVIAPKSKIGDKIKNFVITAIFAGILAVFIYLYKSSNTVKQTNDALLKATESSALASGGAEFVRNMPYYNAPEIALWFFGGVIFAIILILILNWRKL